MSRKSLVPIQLPADPTQPLEAATKQYVDALAGSEVEIGPSDPIGSNAFVELWYDTDAPSPTVGFGIPPGGTSGQTLTKQSASDYDAAWVTEYGSWTTPTLINGWTNNGAPYQNARYRKIGDIVYLEGLINFGTLSAAAFVLPVGFRPTGNSSFAVVSNGVYGRLTIDAATGNVIPAAGAVNMFINVSFAVS